MFGGECIRQHDESADHDIDSKHANIFKRTRREGFIKAASYFYILTSLTILLKTQAPWMN